MTKFAEGAESIDQPTTRRENASSTTTQHTLPSRVGVLGAVSDTQLVRLVPRERAANADALAEHKFGLHAP